MMDFQGSVLNMSSDRDHCTADGSEARYVDSPTGNAFVSLRDLSLPRSSISEHSQILGRLTGIECDDLFEDTSNSTPLAKSDRTVNLDLLDCLDVAPSALCEPAEESQDQSYATQHEAGDETEPAKVRQSNSRKANDRTSASSKYRARNRLAASRCRQKQKVHREALQKDAEQQSADNKRLKRQEHLLRNVVTFLRDCALQHDSTRCGCDSLHAFNIQRAEQVHQLFSGRVRE